jgi:CRP/FNR family cyclic AMP-dependent transcriptional regulator
MPPELESRAARPALDPALAAAFAGAERLTIAPGAVLFRAGDEDRRVFFVEDGVLDVTVPKADGGVRTLARLHAGEVVGELSWLLGRPRSATVVARARATLRALAPHEHGDEGMAWLRTLAHLLARRVQASTALLA